MSEKFENVLYVRTVYNSKDYLEIQKQKGKWYADQHSIPGSIIEDIQTSGKTPLSNRQGASYLLNLVETGLVEKIIVNSLDRISRDFVYLCCFFSFLEKYDVTLVSLDTGKEYLGEGKVES
jgi:DNA invertase Pin-like site-specific DNA recombinase